MIGGVGFCFGIDFCGVEMVRDGDSLLGFFGGGSFFWGDGVSCLKFEGFEDVCWVI